MMYNNSLASLGSDMLKYQHNSYGVQALENLRYVASAASVGMNLSVQEQAVNGVTQRLSNNGGNSGRNSYQQNVSANTSSGSQRQILSSTASYSLGGGTSSVTRQAQATVAATTTATAPASLPKRGKPEHERQHVCTFCDKKFARQDTLNKHMMTHTGERPYECSGCDSKFIQKVHLDKHVRRVHLTTPAQLTAAAGGVPGATPDTTTTTDNRSYHVQPLKGNGPTTTSAKMNRAVQQQNVTSLSNGVGVNKSASLPMPCPVCHAMFASSLALQEHLNTVHAARLSNTVDRKFRCDVCGARFARKSNLEVHARLHSGQRPYQCSLCPRGFIRSDTLKKHVASHHKDRGAAPDAPLPCDQCHLRFQQPTQLRRHQLWQHARVAPAQCHICGREFFEQPRLLRHLERHANSERHRCDLCERKFFTHRSLLGHWESAHSGRR